MDRRRLSYASVAGGTSGASGSAAAFSHLMSTSPSSPIRNSFYPAATAERTSSSSYQALDDGNKSTSTFWGKGATTQTSWSEQQDPNAVAQQRMSVRPTYLVGSKYLERLDAQYKARLARQIGHRTPSLSKSSSGTSLHRMAPSHRGMTYEIVENTPPEAEDDLTPPLPSRWAEKDKNGGLELMGNTEVKYVGTNKGHELDAAATRTDHPIPRRCGIYYYEVTVLTKGKDGMIAIGFSTSKAVLEKLPGWEPESWAYHGDDGKSFGCAQVGKQYGPVFSVDDVVGCGINFRTGKAFFTKNGVFLGNAFHDLKQTLQQKKVFPSVGMKRPGAHVWVNFGQAPFEFDIDELVRVDRKLVRDEIAKRNIAQLQPKLTAPELVSELISQYLRHDGFIRTAESFSSEVAVEAACLRQDPHSVVPSQSSHDSHAIQRQRIRSAILDGDIDQALILTQTHYPSVLEMNPAILFRLKCRKFIEMMRLPTYNTTPTSNRTIRKAKSRSDQDMDIDAHDNYEDENGRDRFGSDTNATVRLEQALKYAQELGAEYKTDDSKEVAQALQEIFALFAYEDPRNSPAAGLMDVAGRLPVAEGLNSAILVSLGAPSTTALELIYQQTQALLEDNIDHGGSGALINLDRNIDRSIDVQRRSTGDDTEMIS